jgi:hydroxyacyl-ACP dehydratase HTD2-like protein with hotdog domain
MSEGPVLADVEVGLALPMRVHTPDNVELFMYNAALWNAHRIHFDRPYAIGEEGYEGLVIAGPQMGDWLGQVVDNWLLDAGDILNLSYSNRGAALIGESLTASGEITAIEGNEISIDLHIKNEQGDVITPGTASVRLNR